MTRGLIISLLAICTLINLVISEDCKFVPPCQCVSTGFTLDLRNTVRPLSVIDGDYTYYIDPCGDHAKVAHFCNVAEEAGCQVKQSSIFGIASTSGYSATGDPFKNNVVFKNQYGEGTEIRVTLLNIKCNYFSEGHLVFVQETPPKTYNFTLETNRACTVPAEDDDGGLSGGSVLLIIFFVLLIVYLVGGVLFLKFVRRAEGLEAIPNYEFWKDFPSLVKDGVKFTCRGCKAESTYEKI
ncbi:putative mannose 6-phosphate receptor-like protein C530.09c [Aplysia californica]|uniref:Mannose 6-phosphate receptor-like protein C530.09c n=1 Tax=Aplysia californica TaxID=6500 RepID=A0ABM0JBZ8_APLCA|nr:putative mannose 6-phosphate receptor-like protein C530.09c [Aplysia californica]